MNARKKQRPQEQGETQALQISLPLLLQLEALPPKIMRNLPVRRHGEGEKQGKADRQSEFRRLIIGRDLFHRVLGST